jgi:hypothetical protein
MSAACNFLRLGTIQQSIKTFSAVRRQYEDVRSVAQNEIEDATCKIVAFDLYLGDLNAELCLDFGTRYV